MRRASLALLGLALLLGCSAASAQKLAQDVANATAVAAEQAVAAATAVASQAAATHATLEEQAAAYHAAKISAARDIHAAKVGARPSACSAPCSLCPLLEPLVPCLPRRLSRASSSPTPPLLSLPTLGPCQVSAAREVHEAVQNATEALVSKTMAKHSRMLGETGAAAAAAVAVDTPVALPTECLSVAEVATKAGDFSTLLAAAQVGGGTGESRGQRAWAALLRLLAPGSAEPAALPPSRPCSPAPGLARPLTPLRLSLSHTRPASHRRLPAWPPL